MYATMQAGKRGDSKSHALRDGRPGGREGVREMKKLIAAAILFGALALSAMPALAQTTNCYQFGSVTQCQSY